MTDFHSLCVGRSCDGTSFGVVALDALPIAIAPSVVLSNHGFSVGWAHRSRTYRNGVDPAACTVLHICERKPTNRPRSVADMVLPRRGSLVGESMVHVLPASFERDAQALRERPIRASGSHGGDVHVNGWTCRGDVGEAPIGVGVRTERKRTASDVSGVAAVLHASATPVHPHGAQMRASATRTAITMPRRVRPRLRAMRVLRGNERPIRRPRLLCAACAFASADGIREHPSAPLRTMCGTGTARLRAAA